MHVILTRGTIYPTCQIVRCMVSVQRISQLCGLVYREVVSVAIEGKDPVVLIWGENQIKISH